MRLSLPPWIVVVGGLALAVGFAIAAILQVSNALPSEILAALKPVEETNPGDGTFHIVIVDGGPTGVARGMQLGLLALVLGGLPAALLGAALLRWSKRERPWSRDWQNAFLAGFVFQLSSLMVTTLLLGVFLWAAYDSGIDAREVAWPAGLLLVGSVSGVWGLRSWRVLQFQIEESKPPSGSKRQL